MKQETQHILQEAFNKLPESVRRALTAVDLRPKLKKIAGEHSLRTDEAGVLEDEVALVLFGLEHSNRLVGNLKKHAHLDSDKATLVAHDVDEKILVAVREKLKTLWDTKVTEAHQSVVSTPTQQTGGRAPEGLARSVPRDMARAQGESAAKEKLASSGLFADAVKIVEKNMTSTTSSSNYTDSDPYREPIE